MDWTCHFPATKTPFAAFHWSPDTSRGWRSRSRDSQAWTVVCVALRFAGSAYLHIDKFRDIKNYLIICIYINYYKDIVMTHTHIITHTHTIYIYFVRIPDPVCRDVRECTCAIFVMIGNQLTHVLRSIQIFVVGQS